ncbi:MAG: hypothetical protein DME42_06855 [Verrucomicrobia bacterium]|nr:MAG: hypothetical protein DME42_06855 [Verrucomicrobiota bacterium]
MYRQRESRDVPTYRGVAQFHWDKPSLLDLKDSVLSDKRDAKPHLERSHRPLRFGGQKSICGSTGKTVCRPVIPIFGIGPVGAKE